MWGRKAMSRTLSRFEDALAAEIEASTASVPPRFRFTNPGLKDLIFKEGVHIFLNDLPDPKDIDVPDPLLDGYIQGKDPTIGIFTEPGSGFVPSASVGGRGDWILRIVLRAGSVHEDAKEQLEELAVFLERDLRGSFGGFLMANVVIESRPRVVLRREDDYSYAQATLRFMAVSAT